MMKTIRISDIGAFAEKYLKEFSDKTKTADKIISSYASVLENSDLTDAEKRYYGYVSAEKSAALDAIRNPGIFEKTGGSVKLFFRPENKAVPHILRGDLLKEEDVIYRKMGVMAPEISGCGSYYERLIKSFVNGCPCRVTKVTSNPLTALYFAASDGCGKMTVFAVPENEISYPSSDKALMLSCLPLLSYAQKKDLYEAADFSLSAGRFRQLKGGTRYLDDAPEELYRIITTEKPYFRREISPADLLKPLFVSPDRSDIKAVKQDIYYMISGLCMSEAEAHGKIFANAVGEFEITDKEKILSGLDLLGINGAALCADARSAAEYIKENYGR